MVKYCIFCGGAPSKKNKEHIIPKWLIEFTGDPKRMASLGIPWNDPNGIRAFSWSSFHFPACESCNTKYSELEGAVKSIFFKMSYYSPLTAEELNLLLDWFDKVRIGLWLGMRYLNQNVFVVKPKFYIDQRIGAKDRVLIIYDSKYPRKKLVISGVDTPAFSYAPSVFLGFMLTIFIF